MKLRIIGSGEAFDSGPGNNAFLLHGGRTPNVLFDCGYQIPERLWAAGLHRAIDAGERAGAQGRGIVGEPHRAREGSHCPRSPSRT